MKVFVMLTIFLPGLAHALSCDGHRKDLMALEYKLQNLKMNTSTECLAKAQAKYQALLKEYRTGIISYQDLLKRDDRFRCQNKNQLVAEYNKAIGELTIAEGIASLQLSIEGNHNAITDMSEKEINRGLSYFEKLEDSLTQADILYKAIETADRGDGKPKNSSIFKGHQTSESLSEHLLTKCQAGDVVSLPATQKSFCQSLVQLNKQNFPQYKKSIEMLQGFIKASDPITGSDQELVNKFEKAKEKLYIQMHGKNKSPADFKKTTHWQKDLMQLKKDLLTLKEKRKNKINDPLLNKRIIKKANKLSKVKMHYKSANTASEDLTKFLDDHFQNVVTSIDLPGAIQEGGIKDNFYNNIKRMENNINLAKKADEQVIQDFLTSIKTTPIKGKTIEKICSNKYDANCLARLCGKTQSRSPEKCYNLNANAALNNKALKMLPDAYNRLKTNTDRENALNIAKWGQKCIQQNDGLSKKQKCLRDKQKKYGLETDLSKLRKNVEMAQHRLNLHNDTPNIKQLNLYKGIALEALTSNYCRKKYDNFSYDGMRSDCIASNRLVTDYTVLDLALDGEAAMIELNSNQLNEFLDKSLSRTAVNNLREEFKQKCEQNKIPKLHNLCRLYQDQKEFAVRLEEERNAIANEVVLDPGVYEEPDWFAEGAKTFLLGTVQQAPALAWTWVNYEDTKWRTKRQLADIENMNEYYKSMQTWQQNYIDSTGHNPLYYSNYGYPNYDFSYQGTSTFQANTPRLYSGVSNQFLAYNHTVAPPRIYSMPTGINPSGATQSTTPTPASFNFKL